MLRFSGAGVSDVGLVRPSNEDSAFVGPYVALVADGVGGAAAGEIASATAAYAVAATVLQRPGVDAAAVVADAFAAARDNVRLGIQRDLTRLGMATTLTVVVCDGRSVVLGHVGDSRAYLLRGGELRQITTDHTYVQHLVEQGRLSDERPGHAPVAQRRPALRRRRPRGHRPRHHPPGRPRRGPAADLQRRADRPRRRHPDRRRPARARPGRGGRAVDPAALAAGGRDNITCVVVDVIDGPRVVGDGRLLGAVGDPRNIVDAAAVRLA